jgi:hypothetical protein
MECFCGCRRKVPGQVLDNGLRATDVGLELLAWDKARADRDPADPDALDEDVFIDRGGECYQRLIATIHGEDDPTALADSDGWMAESYRRRENRTDITAKGSLFHRAKLQLNEKDYARLDRKRPEASFTGQRGADGSPAADPVAQREHLEELHRAGILTDAEFDAARARIDSGP